jgi:hypothetical protein
LVLCHSRVPSRSQFYNMNLREEAVEEVAVEEAAEEEAIQTRINL